MNVIFLFFTGECDVQVLGNIPDQSSSCAFHIYILQLYMYVTMILQLYFFNSYNRHAADILLKQLEPILQVKVTN